MSKEKSRQEEILHILHSRRFPIGAEIIEGGGVNFRLWAPLCRRVEIVLEEGNENVHKSKRTGYELTPERNDYFSATVKEAHEGSLYYFRLDGSDHLYPDPASRFQPEGPHGPSQVVNPRKFEWTDGDWMGIPPQGQVIYEMHVGTFTQEGTYESAIREFGELSEMGVTILEVMPLADFTGSFGWGYDGVDLFAPTRLYGKPDDLRNFINQAHKAGMGVILDVVYNHLGPDGNYLKAFSKDYFTDKYENEWGEAINFDGKNSAPVREFFISNARYWIEEFHFDGLRMDATQQIFDESPVHVLAEISKTVRQSAGTKNTFIVAENEPQHVILVKPADSGGYGMDCLWNDDLHHSAMVALTGHSEAYYTDYSGKPQELISAFKWGYLYQGQYYKWQKKRRGSPSLGLRPENFCTFIQNHDQVANSGRGQRVHELTSPGRYKAMTALFLLAPGTPMLFQGQEFAATSPFFYFADHNKELAKMVARGRSEFLSQFPSLATPEMQSCLPDPGNKRTFERSKLDFSDRKKNRAIYKMHHDLLRLRREDPVLSKQRPGGIDGAVLGEEAFLLRFFTQDGQDRLLLVNFGRDLLLDIMPEPLLAPPLGKQWKIAWASEDPDYGGCGSPAIDTGASWRIQGQAAALLIPEETLHETLTTKET
ncbi:MAG: malto-oligosyltrehalose trehalohydrolase [Ignavibacteriales bacterium]